MNKKFKIIIPESGLTKEQIEILGDRELSIKWFVENQGKVFDYDYVSHFPDFLIEEVRQPIEYAGEFLRENPRALVGLDGEDLRIAFERGWNKAKENERLKHEPKQSFQELIENEYRYDPGDEIYMMLSKWFKIIEKNRGYNNN